MAIYHCSVKTISRSAGRSSTGAAAYRAGCEIADERTGEIHDYTRKGGVVSSAIFVPDGAPTWATDRAKLWNAVERAETRKNSTVAREFEIALPEELSPADRQKLAHDFAREIMRHHGCAVDVSIHAPAKDGDNRNHHAHILCSTRRLTPEGFTEKTRELDDQKSGPQMVAAWRERWATLQNERFAELGLSVRVDHRSLEAQGIDREPTQHLGPAATGYERRTGQTSRKRQDFEAVNSRPEVTDQLSQGDNNRSNRVGAEDNQVRLGIERSEELTAVAQTEPRNLNTKKRDRSWLTKLSGQAEEVRRQREEREQQERIARAQHEQDKNLDDDYRPN